MDSCFSFKLEMGTDWCIRREFVVEVMPGKGGWVWRMGMACSWVLFEILGGEGTDVATSYTHCYSVTSIGVQWELPRCG